MNHNYEIRHINASIIHKGVYYYLRESSRRWYVESYQVFESLDTLTCFELENEYQYQCQKPL